MFVRLGRKILTAILWAILIASATILGGYAGLYFGLGVIVLIALAFSFRRRFRLLGGWTLREFVLTLGAAILLSILLWFGFWQCVLIIMSW